MPASTCSRRWAGDRRDRDGTGGSGEHARHPHRGRRHLGRHLQPRAGGEDRARARHRARDDPRRVPGWRGGAGAAQRRAIRRVAERFELYACGVELANAFGELTDPAEQRRRFEAEMAEKQRLYGERYPIDEDFLAALAAHAAGQRRGARLRPAGDAGDGRQPHRAGAVDAGGGAGRSSGCVKPLRSMLGARRQRAWSAPERHRRCEAVAARYAVAMTPGDRGPDRPRRPGRPDRAPVRARCPPSWCTRPRSAPTRSATRPTRRCEGIVHRYPDRVLLKLIHVCPVYCRFCFRREMVGPGGPQALTAEALDAALRLHRRRMPEIWEVILTGGDPLVLSPRRLGEVTRAARGHRRTSRWCAGTRRVPVVGPGRGSRTTLVAALSTSAARPSTSPSTPTTRAS